MIQKRTSEIEKTQDNLCDLQYAQFNQSAERQQQINQNRVLFLSVSLKRAVGKSETKSKNRPQIIRTR